MDIVIAAIFSLLLTAITYGLFPIVFAYLRKKPITLKGYRTAVIVVTVVIKIFIVLFFKSYSWGPTLLWGGISYKIGKNILTKKRIMDVDINDATYPSEVFDNAKSNVIAKPTNNVVLDNKADVIMDDSVDETSEISNSVKEEFYFENIEEFLAYIKVTGKKSDIVWLKGSNYVDQYKVAYDLFEKGHYSRSVEEYRKCIELNPVAIHARFEIAEVYLRWNKEDDAIRELVSIVPFLTQPRDIARFYRRYGYALTEKGMPKVSAACYLYSMEFEKSPTAIQELMYISQKFNYSVEQMTKNKVQKTLRNENIPIIEQVAEELTTVDESPIDNQNAKVVSTNVCEIGPEVEVDSLDGDIKNATDSNDSQECERKFTVSESSFDENEATISSNIGVKSICSYCGKELKANSKFCGHCGKPVAIMNEQRYCHHCGFKLKPGSKFCSQCGAKIM